MRRSTNPSLIGRLVEDDLADGREPSSSWCLAAIVIVYGVGSAVVTGLLFLVAWIFGFEVPSQ